MVRTKIKVQVHEKTTTFKGRCSHCGKWGHKKAKCREWLKLTHEEQDKAHKECSEEKPKKSMQHIQCYNCNKTGHIARECPEKKVNDPSGGSSGGFAMMCIERTDPPELNSEENTEMHTEEESWTLQDGIDQSHKNEV